MAYYHLERCVEAIDRFNRIIDRRPDSEGAQRAQLMIARCQQKLGQYGLALSQLRMIRSSRRLAEIHDEAAYLLGWAYIDLGQWERAAEAFSAISGANRQYYRYERLNARLAQATAIERKSPALAGLLSVVPGLGQLYCGRYRDAAVAFGLNALLTVAAVESFQNDMNALGAMLTLLEIGFYSANIYSGINSAHKFNRSAQQRFSESLRRHLRLDITHTGKEKGVCLRWRVSLP